MIPRLVLFFPFFSSFISILKVQCNYTLQQGTSSPLSLLMLSVSYFIASFSTYRRLWHLRKKSIYYKILRRVNYYLNSNALFLYRRDIQFELFGYMYIMFPKQLNCVNRGCDGRI